VSQAGASQPAVRAARSAELGADRLSWRAMDGKIARPPCPYEEGNCVSSTEPSGRLTVIRWIVAAFLLGLISLVGFVAYSRYMRPPESTCAQGSNDPRLDSFLARADEQLVVGDLDGAKEQYVKASGVSDRDPRVVLGLARVEILRAELQWWRWLALPEGDAERGAAEQSLTQAVKRAQEAIDQAVEKAPTDGGTTRLQVDRLRLEAMAIFMMARTGKREPADKSLAQLEARHHSHPLLESLRKIVESASKPREQLDAGAPAPSASASASAAPTGGKPHPDNGNYEFDREPPAPTTSPGELQVPGGKAAPSPPSDTPVP